MTPEQMRDVSLLDLYRMEADAQAQVLDAGLLVLEREPSHAGQLEACMRAAHSLKGSASNMGGKALSALSSAIEKAAQAGDMAHCSILVAELPFLANRTRQALQAYIDQA